jgi:hypothetical protein
MARHSTAAQDMRFLYCPGRHITSACRRHLPAFAPTSLRLPGAAEAPRSVPKTQGTINPASLDLHTAFGGHLL